MHPVFSFIILRVHPWFAWTFRVLRALSTLYIDMYSDTRGVHVHPVHPGWIRPCYVLISREGFITLMQIRIRIRIVYWWNAETTITHQDLWLGNESLALTREVNSNTILCIFSGWDQRIGEGIPIPYSLGEEATFINICIGNGSLKCHRVLISTTPSFEDKVICWYTGFTFKTFI